MTSSGSAGSARVPHPTADSSSGLPSRRWSSSATSTIRIAFFADSATSRMMPIWV